MIPVYSLLSLFTSQTAQQILDASLALAEFLGLPTTTWRVGDPTRTQLEAQAQHLAQLDAIAAEMAKGAYLSTAEGEWLDIKAQEDFGVTRPAATYASGTATIANTSAEFYSWEPNALTLQNPTTGKTYKNSETVTLSGVGSTAEFVFTAEEAGSESSTDEDSLELLTTVLGVSLTGNTIATGVDAARDPAYRELARLSTSALSPNGPSDVFRYVALNSELTGVTTVQKAAVDGDSTTGIVTVYVSGYEADILTDDLEAVEAALLRYALGMCQTLVLDTATQVPVDLVVDVVLKRSSLGASAVEDLAETKIVELFQDNPIGGDIYTSAIVGAVYASLPAGSFSTADVTSHDDLITAAAYENLYLNSLTINASVEA